MANGTAQWMLTVPANATGWLPLPNEEAGNYKLDGVAIGQSKLVSAAERDGKAGFVLPAGRYSFTVSWVK
jgi:hypothetical protein